MMHLKERIGALLEEENRIAEIATRTIREEGIENVNSAISVIGAQRRPFEVSDAEPIGFFPERIRDCRPVSSRRGSGQ